MGGINSEAFIGAGANAGSPCVKLPVFGGGGGATGTDAGCDGGIFISVLEPVASGSLLLVAGAMLLGLAARSAILTEFTFCDARTGFASPIDSGGGTGISMTVAKGGTPAPNFSLGGRGTGSLILSGGVVC